MLQKDLLVKFLEKIYLNKTIDSFVVESSSGNLSTFFESKPGFKGNVTLSNYNINDGNIGVYYPSELLKILSFLESDIEIKLDKNKKDEVVAIKLKDKKGKLATYATMDIETIVRPSSNIVLDASDSEIQIELNIEIINDLLKAHSIINHPLVVFQFEKEKLFAVFGKSDNNTNQIKIEIETQKLEDIGEVAFSGSKIHSILSINAKKFKSGKIFINSKGYMYIQFEENDIIAEYFLKEENKN